MGMTMTQKILAAHAGEASVKAGQLIQAKLDVVMGNDITTAVALKEFKKTGAKEVFDKEKVVIVLDHFTPNKDIKAAEQCKACRTFAYDMEVKNFFDVGQMGIEHALLPEKASLYRGRPSSAQTLTPVPTAHWVLSPQVSAAQIWRSAWPQGKHGSKYPAQSNSC